MTRITSILALTVAILIDTTLSFPSYASLAGLTREELDQITPTLQYQPPEPPPPAIADTSSKLVNDPAHPWLPLRPGDIRGPCPGLNTLASHGYLPRNGIATPAQLITASQEGFNMAHDFAAFLSYFAHLVDGNLLTNLVSIGGASPLTGPAPPAPAMASGMNTHGLFEGDASSTRNDAFLGNNHDFNETLFDQLVDYSNKYGNGKYNLTVAGEFKFRRIMDSIATNPQFVLTTPRFFTIYAEAAFPVNFFVDGRQADGQVDMATMRSFMQNMQMPKGFFRRNGTLGPDGFESIAAAHPISPGTNVGRVNNYVPDPTSATLAQFCLLYSTVVSNIVEKLYPSPTGNLRESLKTNLGYLYTSLPSQFGCTQIFPYGQ